MIIQEYLYLDKRPKKILVAGWAEQSVMRSLLRELDHGQNATPPGSEVVFVNSHDTASSLASAIRVSHQPVFRSAE